MTDEQIKAKILEISREFNVVVIVPSKERARFWDPFGSQTVTKENIKAAVQSMKVGHVGFRVFVNRYDGIDLPGDACRMLVIDGLPPLHTEYDKYVQSIDANSSILFRQQVQRIEQGMGRGVRSNSDSCCIVLMGDQLVDVLLRNKGVSFFGTATNVQFELSKDVWNLLKDEDECPSADSIFELAGFSLHRDPVWIQNSKARLSDVFYSSESHFDNMVVALRKAYDYALFGDLQGAINEINDSIQNVPNLETKGYLYQLKAAYINQIDKSMAQQALLSGRKINKGILIPINGIQYDKAINGKEQAKAVCDYINSCSQNQNEYRIYVNAVLDGLRFSTDPEDTDTFEKSMMNLGQILGFISTRPEKETAGQGPDNLWAIGNGKYLVIECKSGATTPTISKNDCNQLGGAARWFSQEYGAGFSCVPIMVHKSIVIHDLAAPVEGMRIIDVQHMDKMKRQVEAFSIAVVQNDNWKNEHNILTLLQQYHLRSQDIVEHYSQIYKG